MIDKKCDWCKKVIETKGKSEYPWAEWCVFHHKKRRDFCSHECFISWFNDYFKEVLAKKTKKKLIKIKVTKEMQEEMNEVRKECGFEPEPIKEEYELDALFG